MPLNVPPQSSQQDLAYLPLALGRVVDLHLVHVAEVPPVNVVDVEVAPAQGLQDAVDLRVKHVRLVVDHHVEGLREGADHEA